MMRRWGRAALVLLLALVAFMAAGRPPAMAQTDNTAEVRRILQEALDRHTAEIRQRGRGDMIWEGELEVAPAGEYTRVQFPRLVMTYADGSKLDVGRIAMNMKPGTAAGEWNVSLAIPSPMVMMDYNNEPVAEITIGGQRFAGVWRVKDDMYPKLDAQYDNVKFSSFRENIVADIDSLRLQSSLEQDDKGLWGGFTNMAVKGVRAGGSTSNSITTIGGMVIKTRVNGMKVESRIDVGHKAAPEEGAGVLEATGWSADDFSMDFTLTGLNVQASDAFGPYSIGMQEAGFTLYASRLREDTSDAGLGWKFAGLVLGGLPEDMQKTAPQEGQFNLHVEKIPLSGMMETTMQALTGAAQMTAGIAEGPQAIQGSFLSFPELMAKAGTRLSIKDTFVTTPSVNATLEGEALPNAKALYKATADMTLVIGGMDSLLLELAPKTATPDADPQLQKLVASLTMLQMMGEKEEAGGIIRRRFRFQLMEDGRTLLNGTDFSTLMKMQGGGDSTGDGTTPR